MDKQNHNTPSNAAGPSNAFTGSSQTNQTEQNYNQSIAQKPKRSAKTVILVIVFLLVVSPFLFTGGIIAYCGIKDWRMNRLAGDITRKVENSGLNVSVDRSIKNGDCLTGNGANFIININEKYKSPIAARDDIFAKFSAAGIDMPSLESQKGRTSARNLKGATGGNTPIEVIQMYFIYKGNSMSVDYELEKKAECVVTTSREVLCEGVPKDQLIDNIVENGTVTSTSVQGSISFR